MAMKLGDVIPDFMAESTQGPIALHDYIEGRWAILFSHPNDFTPVCTTELASVATLMPQFAERGVKVLALSCNTLSSHLEWIRDIESVAMAQAAAARRRVSGVMAEKEASSMAEEEADDAATGSRPSPLLNDSGFLAMEEKQPESKASGSMPGPSPLLNDSEFPAMEEKQHGSEASGSPPGASPLSDILGFPVVEQKQHESASELPPGASQLLNNSGFPAMEEKQHGSEASGSGSPPRRTLAPILVAGLPPLSPPTVSYPILCDPDRSIAVRLGILDPSELDPSGSSLAARAVLILGPDKRLRASILYPASTGRNFSEILRVLDSLQLTDSYGVATPVDWKHGDPCMVLPGLANDVARERFPKGFETIPVPSGRGYLRVTPQPAAQPLKSLGNATAQPLKSLGNAAP